ncbi:MAG: DUF1064 domain-containing protein, partial [Actinobacteria bacterium]|nr:DUF1064 domain-containing protein [Actinomycetota bacterium]
YEPKRKKVEMDGYIFDSKKESVRYQELKLLEKAGKISGLKVHPSFLLWPAFRDGHTKKLHRAISYYGDFQYIEKEHVIVEDTKGFKTKDFKIKEKLFRRIYPEIIFRIL